MFSLFCASLLVTVAVVVDAAPLAGYGGAAPATASFNPLAVALSILPIPLLVAFKYTYVRFRRGQSIHAHPHTSSSVPGSPLCSSAVSLPGSGDQQSPSNFWGTVTPYLVGCLGSPHWETTIRSRLDKTLRQAKIDSRRSSRRSMRSPPCSPAMGDYSRSTVNTSSAYYSSFSHKSGSRSKSASMSFGDSSGEKPPSPRFTSHGFSAITDCALIHPSSPPCHNDVFLSVPPPAHLVHKVSRSSSGEHSPTLMQLMEPVLSSWYDDSKGKRPLYDSLHSSDDVLRERSAMSSDPSLPFQTPMTSPPTPGMPGAYMPFSALRKQLGISAASSSLSLCATTCPSPASVSQVVFHSPIAPSICVPQPIHTPGRRPDSCAVLPSEWHIDRDRLGVHNLLQSPTHRSPAVGRPSGIYAMLANPAPRPSLSPRVSFSPVLGAPTSPVLSRANSADSSAGPIVLKSALKKRGSACASPLLSASVRNSVSFSFLSVDASHPSADCSATSILSVSSAANLTGGAGGQNRGSWDLSDLMRNGQLDVDSILGLGLDIASRSSVALATSVHALTEAETSADVDAGVEYDIAQYASGWASPQLADATGWASPQQLGGVDEGEQMRWHVHGLQLCAIPEETRSDVCSVVGSVHVFEEEEDEEEEEYVEEEEEEEAVQDSGVVSMDMGSGVVSMDMGSELVGDASEVEASFVRHESWREGESVVTLSVGIAW
ncbi:hypothetical protein C2E23DRAFT_741715 [Lenzites betulinus]|nr:hypothetical protein C2E23DRAFT_741715 [Lenzites betulinus]